MQLLAVNFHYIRDVAPSSGIHPVSLSELLRMASLLNRYFPLGNQPQLLRALEGDERIVKIGLITFDDGLKEQMKAARALEDKGWAALFFVPTAPFRERDVLQVHKIHHIRMISSDADCAASLESRFGRLLSDAEFLAADKQYPYDNSGAKKVKYLLNFVADPIARTNWVNQEFERLFGSAAAAADDLYMSADDVRWLAKREMLGTHGHSHRPLSQLPIAEIKYDISTSIECLKEITGCAPQGISYPYGGRDAVDDRVAAVSKAHELRFGFTMSPGIVETDDEFNPLLLQRFNPNDLLATLESREKGVEWQ